MFRGQQRRGPQKEDGREKVEGKRGYHDYFMIRDCLLGLYLEESSVELLGVVSEYGGRVGLKWTRRYWNCRFRI